MVYIVNGPGMGEFEYGPYMWFLQFKQCYLCKYYTYYCASIGSLSLGASFGSSFDIGGAIFQFVAVLRCMRNINAGGSDVREVGTNIIQNELCMRT